MEFQDGGEDEADVDMKAHGSVLSHLLSQVRIGMDLTKVITRLYSIKYKSSEKSFSSSFEFL